MTHGNNENFEHCKSIANTLEQYANGELYKCPICGEVHTMTEYEANEHEDEAGQLRYTCPNCGGDIEESELEAVSLWDYFTDCYDIEYRIGSDKQFRSVCVMVACGGPNIYIDTQCKAVLLRWWTESAEYPISYEAAEAVNEYFEELFNC